MRKIRHFLSAAIFISLFSITIIAQDIPNYLFVEVIDSNQKPLKDARVSLTNPDLEVARSRQDIENGILTDNYGAAHFSLPHIFNNFSKTLFKITKPGYFDFFDFGVPMSPRDQVSVKIELFKIPSSDDEKKTLGDEQIKREFLWAAKNGDAESVINFLKKGINPNLTTNDLRGVSEPKNVPAIAFAAASGDSKTVKTLLKAGANVRVKDEPLHSVLAVYLRANPLSRKRPQTESERKNLVEDYQKGIKDLIKAGAATSDLFGWTALRVAAGQNDADSVKLLIESGVSVNDKAEKDRALMTAVSLYGSNRAGFSPIKVVEVLLEAGANPNFAYNPLGDANCSSVMMQAVWGGDLKVVKLLIDNKADVNFTCKNGDTALTRAKQYLVGETETQQEMIKLLKDAGAKE